MAKVSRLSPFSQQPAISQRWQAVSRIPIAIQPLLPGEGVLASRLYKLPHKLCLPMLFGKVGSKQEYNGNKSWRKGTVISRNVG